MMADFERLKNNIIDMLVEQQLKLGYMSESVALYYPIESLQGLLDVSCDELELKQLLATFSSNTHPILGGVTFSNNKDRFCLRIPPQGGAYVHKMMANQKDDKYHFLDDFLQTISKHNLAIEDITEVFVRYSKCVVVKQVIDDDFDYLIYFEDGKPDDYRYCIKYEGEHATYHRFTESDFNKLGFNVA